MAVPKRKTSPSRRGMRNAHRSLTAANVVECNQCGLSKLPHHVCDGCGFYNGKKIISTKKDKQLARQKAEDAELDATSETTAE